MKLSIRGRVLMLVLTSVFAALLLVEVIFYSGFEAARHVVDEQEAAMAESMNTSVEESVRTSLIDEAAAANLVAQISKAAMELSVARNIQEGALPKDFLTSQQRFELYASMDAARELHPYFR